MEVLTYSGAFVEKLNCVEINDIWYEICDIKDPKAEGAVKIRGIFYPTRILKFNFTTKSWSRSENLMLGYVDDFELGWFQKDFTKMVSVKRNNLVKYFYDFTKLPENFYFCPVGFYYTDDNKNLKQKPEYGITPNYNFLPEGVYDAVNNNFFYQFCDNYDELNTPDETKLTKLFNKYKFGLEFETCG